MSKNIIDFAQTSQEAKEGCMTNYQTCIKNQIEGKTVPAPCKDVLNMCLVFAAGQHCQEDNFGCAFEQYGQFVRTTTQEAEKGLVSTIDDVWKIITS